MPYQVALTKDAERDLEEIYLFIAERDSRADADRVLERLVQATNALKTSPDRGAYVDELRSLGISEYRQVFFKPNRLIYRVHGKQVVVYVVADGRRDSISEGAKFNSGTEFRSVKRPIVYVQAAIPPAPHFSLKRALNWIQLRPGLIHTARKRRTVRR